VFRVRVVIFNALRTVHAVGIGIYLIGSASVGKEGERRAGEHIVISDPGGIRAIGHHEVRIRKRHDVYD